MSNYAFIDGQNLVASIKLAGWNLDFVKFRTYLSDKYKVDKAFVFVGFIEKFRPIYDSLKKSGYEVIFRPTSANYYSKVQGKVDVELTLHVMANLNRFSKAIIVSGDGDYYCLIEFLKKQNKLEKILVPNKSKYSKLLNFYASGRMDFMNNLQTKLNYEK